LSPFNPQLVQFYPTLLLSPRCLAPGTQDKSKFRQYCPRRFRYQAPLLLTTSPPPFTIFDWMPPLAFFSRCPPYFPLTQPAARLFYHFCLFQSRPHSSTLTTCCAPALGLFFEYPPGPFFCRSDCPLLTPRLPTHRVVFCSPHFWLA